MPSDWTYFDDYSNYILVACQINLTLNLLTTHHLNEIKCYVVSAPDFLLKTLFKGSTTY